MAVESCSDALQAASLLRQCERAPYLLVREHVQPVLQGFTGDKGIPTFFGSMPEIITVDDLRDKITKPEIKAKARGVIKPATLKSLARIIDPTGNFFWRDPPGDSEQKRRPGGNGNNKPRLTLEEQLEEEGVEPLNPRTFSWNADVLKGVPRKGQAPTLNPFLSVLFDHTWLAQQKARCRPLRCHPPPSCPPHSLLMPGMSAGRCRSFACTCGPSPSAERHCSSGKRSCRRT